MLYYCGLDEVGIKSGPSAAGINLGRVGRLGSLGGQELWLFNTQLLKFAKIFRTLKIITSGLVFVEGGRANLPRTASEPHFTYLRQCASP